MKQFFCLLASLLLLLTIFSGCSSPEPAQIAATTLPVYEFTCYITEGTGITVTRLITESVSCLHDYSLNVEQVKAVEAAQVIVISGAGLEEFMEELLQGRQVIDASLGIELLECGHEHDHDYDHGHHHEEDAHIWLAPENAIAMARNICAGLSAQYPEYAAVFSANLEGLVSDLQDLQSYGEARLSGLSTREMITFHDGFGYFAQAFELEILEAVEEESGSEASAQELKHLIGIVREHDLSAVFTEAYGSASAAGVIARETGAGLYSLDMAMSTGYFEAMHHNIDTIKEAMG